MVLEYLYHSMSQLMGFGPSRVAVGQLVVICLCKIIVEDDFRVSSQPTGFEFLGGSADPVRPNSDPYRPIRQQSSIRPE
jgi:hypothetical protein